MSDWAVGDLAVCVDASDTPNYSCCGLRSNATYTVASVLYGINDRDLSPGTGLVLTEIRSRAASGAYDARRFRKVVSDKHEACETEFVTLLKRSKRTVGA